MLPTIEIGGHEISRLIIGGNTISGTSHLNGQLDQEMQDYFSVQKVKEMLFDCMNNGINTMQLRGDKHIMRIMREFRQDGGNLNWIAQTAPEFGNFDGHVKQMMAYNPIIMYHHGCVTDALFKEGNFDEIVRRLDVIRQTGVPVGLGTHMPEVMEYAEMHHWDIDFYMSCVYNISVPEREARVAKEGNEEAAFVASDIPLMYEAIRSVDKPCLAFKILGATRRCETQDMVSFCFDEAFANIKKTDAVVVGMYPKDINQVALNAKYTREAIEKAAHL